MFKRVLLVYDGSEVGRRALKRGAELAMLVGAEVYVLSIIPTGVAGAAVVAGSRRPRMPRRRGGRLSQTPG